MLIHSNATINISRQVESSGVYSLTSVKTGYPVYINPRSDSLMQARDSQGAYKEFIMLTDGIFPLLMGDKVFWGSRTLKVQSGEILSDITGNHGQYVLMEVQDV